MVADLQRSIDVCGELCKDIMWRWCRVEFEDWRRILR